MGKPGSGRYTAYVPSSPEGKNKYLRLRGLFNDRPPANNQPKGDFFDGKDKNDEVAGVLVNNAKQQFVSTTSNADIKQMYGDKISLTYGEAPDTSTVTWTKPGDPANAYVPDLTSPGAGKTEPTDKDTNPEISAEDLKPNLALPTVNTTAPSATAAGLGSISLGQDLEMGKSSVE